MGQPLPAAAAVMTLIDALIDRGKGHQDLSSIIELIETA
jgi:hypothetical protein